MTTLSDYQRALNARRARRYFQSEVHKSRRREFQQELALLRAERQRQNDMAEDAGLPFASLIFNPYNQA